MNKNVLGLDIGGTNMRIGVIDDQNRAHHVRIESSRILTEHSDMVGDLTRYIDRYLEETGARVRAVSIGVPGAVKEDFQTVVQVPNLKDAKGNHMLDNRNLAAPLSKHFHLPVFVDKDTDFLLSYDRAKMGLEQSKVLVAGYIGTGFGGSVLLDGKFLKGKNGVAMDVGHIPFYHSKEFCGCGKCGCAEAHASGRVLQDIWQVHFSDTPLPEIFSRHGDTDVLREFVYSCAIPFAVMATIFSPDVVIAGGGVLEMKDFPRDDFERYVREQTGRAVAEEGFAIHYAKPEKEKGIIGAAICAKMYFSSRKLNV